MNRYVCFDLHEIMKAEEEKERFSVPGDMINLPDGTVLIYGGDQNSIIGHGPPQPTNAVMNG